MKEQKELKEEKYIVCDCAPNNHGKSDTLLGLIKYFTDNFGYKSSPVIITIRKMKDELLLFQLPGKKVVVDTYGDPSPTFSKWLNAAVDTRAEIIFAACRTGKGQKRMVSNIAASHGYKVIWFSNFYWPNSSRVSIKKQNMIRQQEIECLSDLAHML